MNAFPTIFQLIAAIQPAIYCEPSKRRAVLKLRDRLLARNDPKAYQEAATLSTPVIANHFDAVEIDERNPLILLGLNYPVNRRRLTFDSLDEPLEPFYFNLLDWFEREGWQVDKLLDSFGATPGSSVGNDLAHNRITTQREIQNLIRSIHRQALEILNLLEEAGTPAQDTGEPGKGSERPNREVKRELLRSQIQFLQLQCSWLRPHLHHHDGNGSATGALLPKAFNSAASELLLLASKPYPLQEAVAAGELPRRMVRRAMRQAHPVLVVELRLRAAPRTIGPSSHAFRGRIDIVLTSLSLNEIELGILREQAARWTMLEVLSSIEGSSARLVQYLADSARELLEEKTDPEPGQTADGEDVNPFGALWNTLTAVFRRSATGDSANPRPDTSMESVLRSEAILLSHQTAVQLFEELKRARPFSFADTG